MKYSQFNSMVSLTDEHRLAYNSFSDNFLILPQKSTVLKNIDILKSNSPQLYLRLIDAHFIIDKETDEVSLVKDRQQSIDHDQRMYHLTINPTLDCNFKCWYCYESKVPRSRVNEDTTKRIKKLIDNIIVEQPQLEFFSLNFFGGEPLLNLTFVKEIMQYLTTSCSKDTRKMGLSISFTTNGYLLNEKVIEEFSKYNLTCFQITLDGNRKQHNEVRYASKKTGSYDRILRNIKLLLKSNMGVILRINYTSENIRGVADILTDLSDIENKSKLYIQMHRVWQDSNGEDVDGIVHSIIDSFRKKGFVIYKYPLNNVKAPCYADKTNGALINFNGDVFRCTAMNFMQSKRDGYLDESGKIVWENNAYELRKNAKFNNGPCLNCRLLPICNGGCSQKAIEYKDRNYCILNFKEEEKDKAILDKFKYYLQYSSNTVTKLNQV